MCVYRLKDSNLARHQQVALVLVVCSFFLPYLPHGAGRWVHDFLSVWRGFMLGTAIGIQLATAFRSLARRDACE
jgi:hypothetical protein